MSACKSVPEEQESNDMDSGKRDLTYFLKG